MKVVLCTPTRDHPHPAWEAAMIASLPLLDDAGFETKKVLEIACPYVSAARATMLRKALDWGADAVVFIDDDVSWRPSDLRTLIEAPGDVVAGTYRFKKDDEEYMGSWLHDGRGRPVGEMSGDLAMLRADRVPAGFLKVTRAAVAHFMRAYPNLCYGDPIAPHVDLFNHGAHEGVWWGEDYAFSRNWIAAGGDLWLLPELQIDHHGPAVAYPGNLHDYLMRQPGGANDPARQEQSAA